MATNDVKTDRSGAPVVITNPNRPEHQIVLEPLGVHVTATIGGRTIASSSQALLVRERAHSVYEPVVYFPPEDVRAELLVPVDKSSICPIKGTASYYDVKADTRIPEAAWQYKTTYSFDERLARLECLVAFDRNLVDVAFSTISPFGAQQ